tara:strand:+ start:180 stop:290 length:111 start_codon:yes stop_codon:yes gene_type:complete
MIDRKNNSNFSKEYFDTTKLYKKLHAEGTKKLYLPE